MKRRPLLTSLAAIPLVTPSAATATTRERPPGVYAMKGERVTCERGHLVAVFKRDVMVGEMARPDQLQWAFGDQPREGDTIKPCRCGSAVFGGSLKARIEGDIR